MSEAALDYESQNAPQTPQSLEPVRPDVIARLCAMMFLQFFIWGAWYVTTSTFMTEMKMAGHIGLAYTLCPLAAILSPFFLGMIADRYFASERVLAILQLIGGACMFLVPGAAQSGATPFLALILCHALCYMPTLGLTNTIAFHHLTNQEKQFPLIRVFGTLGWIAAGMLISFLKVDAGPTPYYLAGGSAIALGLLAFALPHTPPPAKGKKATIGEVLGIRALFLFKNRSFAVFAVSSFLICIPLAAYYAFAGRMVADLRPAGLVGTISSVDDGKLTIDKVYDKKKGGNTLQTISVDSKTKVTIKDKPATLKDLEAKSMIRVEPETGGVATEIISPPPRNVGGTMSIGQWAEVVFMLIMPWFFVRLGVKWMLAVGMLAWVLRYGLFAIGAPDSMVWMIMLGIGLHGICYDFFFVTGFIYTDKRAGKEIRGQAQGLLVLLTQGLGLGLGAIIAGTVFNTVLGTKTGPDALPLYQTFWLIPCLFALVVLVFFTVLFKDDSKAPAEQ